MRARVVATLDGWELTMDEPWLTTRPCLPSPPSATVVSHWLPAVDAAIPTARTAPPTRSGAQRSVRTSSCVVFGSVGGTL